MQTIAIIGPTASGKSDLAIKMAKDSDANILSLDSLSIYKEIDIASAKPTIEQRDGVRHFGIDVLKVDEHFNVATYISLFKDAQRVCKDEAKPLIIVGGTSFYLKTLIDGISPLPKITNDVRAETKQLMLDLNAAYERLMLVDPKSTSKVNKNDRYRIEKLLHIYLASGIGASKWFELHPKKPLLTKLKIINTDTPRQKLRERIEQRTDNMLQMGLIDEVCYLEREYTRAPMSMRSIGIVEVLEYLDGKSSYVEMREKIITHTAQLAKRQDTFNRNQFAQL